MSMKLDFLLAGLSSIFSLFPHPVQAAQGTFELDDAQAMAKDWSEVGADLKRAISASNGKQETP